MNKSSYFFDNWLFRQIILKTKLKSVYGSTLLRIDGSKFYDYYADVVKKGVENTKWETSNKIVLENLEKHGIDLKDKVILEISGGPGFLSKSMSKLARKVVLTEFSEKAVNAMKAELGIEAVKFDYNKDKIEECVSGKFDIVFVIYSIGFCNDLKRFVNSLRNIINERGIVYISYSPPTLGLMIRWQFDEYTYTRCWPVEVISKCFSEAGFQQIVFEDEGSYRYDDDWYNNDKNFIAMLLLKIIRIIGKFYLFKSLILNKSIIKDLEQKNILQIFQKSSSFESIR
ncbi:MAG: class I SAM-dependent methyltransferase [Candidatus Calescibacterium sp.]|nr:class I SAM-dependent methyltransferase [Candidatus Calescibacterium sp.]